MTVSTSEGELMTRGETVIQEEMDIEEEMNIEEEMARREMTTGGEITRGEMSRMRTCLAWGAEGAQPGEEPDAMMLVA